MALDAELFQAAVKARENAYIPYSHFGVGRQYEPRTDGFSPAAISKTLPMG